MATLLEKVSTLVMANMHALVDQALEANSLAVIDQYLRQVEDNLASLEDAAATVGAEGKALQRKLDEHRRKSADLDRAIDGLLADGNENAAAAAQSRLNSIQRLIGTYSDQLGRHQGEHEKLLEARMKLEARYSAMRQQRAELQTLLELAKTKELVGRTVKGLDDLVGTGDSDIGRIAASIQARLDRANAANELRAASLDEQIDGMLERKQIEAQLAERRRKLAAPTA